LCALRALLVTLAGATSRVKVSRKKAKKMADEDTSISPEEELLEYSRYGESVDLDVLLATGGVDVNYTDDGGNTALHKVKLSQISSFSACVFIIS
jgi:hypothetical protein